MDIQNYKLNMTCFNQFFVAGQCPHRSCGQGEGDCDRDSDCLEGLVCDFDWWWGDDYCKAGTSCTIQMRKGKLKSPRFSLNAH